MHLRLHDLMVAEPELQGMGTTVAGILETGAKITAFWVGDSRIYRMRNGSLNLLSRDDVLDGMLTQCIGGSAIEPLPNAHLVAWPAQDGDRLLVCSDGLSSMISDARIAHYLTGDLHSVTNALLGAALDARGHDNISVVLADC